jgi:branched-chain amino acid transport system substrate-binding protein
MNKTTHIIIGIIVAIIVIAGIWNGVSKKPIAPTTKEPIKIGVITVLTGSGSEYGIATRKGLDLAVEKINNEGGIKGRKIELIYEDDKCDPKVGVAALQKLISVDKTNIIIGTICSSVTLAMGPIAQEKNLLIISSGASNPKIADYPNIFRTWPSDALQGKFIANFVSDKLKVKKAAVIYINNDYGVGLKDAFEKEFIAKGGEIIGSEAIPEGATDVRTQLIKIKSKTPEVTFLATYAKEMGIILKQAKELGFSTQFIGAEGSKDPSVIEIAKEGSEGLIGTVPSSVSSKVRDEFIKLFKEKYNEEPGITADAAYDIPFLLKAVMEKCSDVYDVSCLKQNLLSLQNFEGAIGKITFDKNGDLIGKSYDLFQVENGKFVPYEK